MVRMLVLLLLTLWYSEKKSETFIIFIPLVIAALLVSGDRVNLFGYFVFLYYGLQFRGRWNFGVLATSAYYANSSIRFLVNIFQHGNGFFLKKRTTQKLPLLHFFLLILVDCLWQLNWVSIIYGRDHFLRCHLYPSPYNTSKILINE